MFVLEVHWTGMSKSRRIGNLQRGITQPIPWFFSHICTKCPHSNTVHTFTGPPLCTFPESNLVGTLKIYRTLILFMYYSAPNSCLNLEDFAWRARSWGTSLPGCPGCPVRWGGWRRRRSPSSGWTRSVPWPQPWTSWRGPWQTWEEDHTRLHIFYGLSIFLIWPLFRGSFT